MTFLIKNMVCSRCKMVVTEVFEKNGMKPNAVNLGEVIVDNVKLPPAAFDQLHTDLKKLGFEIIDDRKRRVIEKIKNAIVELVHHSDENLQNNLSAFISDKLDYDYNYLSNIFSESEGITIEKYYIAQKIEKIKELLMYDELTLSQIADRLGYSSVAYLSNQFKKETGLSPTFFKNLKSKNRRNLEDL
ncbi:helix-turn-helix domain-containing protein [Niabella ginsengisoli]|uniref:AraC family transcriptional regulator n=1 Tax=Niabella ginsengisoli TaxID=522298 RepID=A0ABS9SGH0_9BACT|nr:AraC family transcriptional regulator [Niabella ginsengisoli]MCH5597452.1 AraC family transcriptional regulator [Niabella ginsengisoli]